MIESNRIQYIRDNQRNLRSELYNGLQDALISGETDAKKIGQRTILPSSFTGGARNMIQNYQDAVAICRWAGYPDLFITFTCNPKWPEISRFLNDSNQNPEDRPDIVVRMFKTKLDAIIKDFRNKRIFGRVVSVIYTIEFQKRGLPHAHILIFLAKEDKYPTSDDIDGVISAEVPDQLIDPEYHNAVKAHMLHGPCGYLNPKSPCMVDSRCKKHFPKEFVDRTNVDNEGYPIYRRRDNGLYIEKNGVPMNSTWVVPHNRLLLLRYGAHINVEWCNQSRSIKYLFKYINKGHDRVTAKFYQKYAESPHPNKVDETETFYDCRYLSPCEAAWRTFGYEIQYKYPPVERLSFHLPNQQCVTFSDDDNLEEVANRPSVRYSMFQAWFDLNKTSELARSLTYVECPQHFVWKGAERRWKKRDRGFALGRIYYVHPGAGEAYYLRLLLNVRTGCSSYEELRFVHGKQYSTFHDACYAFGLLGDDREYVDAIVEASDWATGPQLRALFATLLSSDCLSDPLDLWNKTWTYLIEGIQRQQRLQLNMKDLELSQEELKNLCLIDIDSILQSRGKCLKDYSSFPELDFSQIPTVHRNKLIAEELQYDRNIMLREFLQLHSSLNDDQREVFETIMNAVNNRKGGMFFVYGYGGTGKTFVWKTLSSCIRSKGMIVLNVASSGIASLLLPGGRTGHSRFKIPLNLNEDSICNINVRGPLAELLVQCCLIIWDEAPMMHKHCFESLDRTLKDIMKSVSSSFSHLPFGGKVVVLGGDFRQILPVIRKGTRQKVVDASVNSSYLWHTCKVLRLTKNMRLDNCFSSRHRDELKQFSDWIASIGDGTVGVGDDGIADIEIPSDLLVNGGHDLVGRIIAETYPMYDGKSLDCSYLNGRAILAPTLDMVNLINERMIDMNIFDATEYLSSDAPCKVTGSSNMLDNVHTTELLNSIKSSGLPDHKLVLKLGVPVMLLRNIDHSAGLCNGTRMIVTRLAKHVVEARVLSGDNSGKLVLLPRITLSPSDSELPVKFQRRQFPLIVSYAMTINKSQGQSLDHVGVFLKRPVFTHGQLYVAVSRVTHRRGLKILICDKEGKPNCITTNVVYKEIFHNL